VNSQKRRLSTRASHEDHRVVTRRSSKLRYTLRKLIVRRSRVTCTIKVIIQIIGQRLTIVELTKCILGCKLAVSLLVGFSKKYLEMFFVSLVNAGQGRRSPCAFFHVRPQST